ncbi:MAG: hypothetical protein HS115_19905 [Spirochaetales bacterium]|nr:hypothetical protein [Spirochaetales bacterium]
MPVGLPNDYRNLTGGFMTYLESLIHTGFGLVRAARETLEEQVEQFQATFAELAFQGSCDHSQTAEELRAQLDSFLSGLSDLGRSLRLA